MKAPSRVDEDTGAARTGGDVDTPETRATLEALRRAELARAGEATRSRVTALSSVALVLLVVFAAVSAALTVANANRRSQKVRLDDAAQRTAHFIRERFGTYKQITRGVSALFRASPLTVDSVAFRDYVASLHLARDYPGVIGVGYVRRVEPRELAELAGTPAAAVWPPGRRDEYLVMMMAEPIDANRGALGFDIGTEPNRRRAALESERTGDAVMTKRVPILMHAANEPGFVLVQAIFPPDEGPADVRRAYGWSTIAITSQEFFAGIDAAAGVRTEIRIVDTDAPSDPLYASPGFDASDAHLVVTRTVAFGGKIWRIEVRRSESFATRSERKEAPAILGFGLVVALLTGLLAWSLRRTRSRAVGLAEEMTAALRRSHAELERLASRDGLTGVANRRAFDAKLTEEWSRAARHRTPLALVMLDIDHFKAFNDAYGHLAGDECLRRVAWITTTVPRRAGEVVARYGGEEFAVILPGTTLDDGWRVAESIRAAIHGATIPHERHPLGRVTASFGVAAVDLASMHDYGDLVHAADEALYRAKHGGRNRVERI